MKSTPQLENWVVIDHNGQQCLAGDVFFHPLFDDGNNITTSSVVGKRGSFVITRSGSKYLLGVVDPQYEERYHDARYRLFSSLPEM